MKIDVATDSKMDFRKAGLPLPFEPEQDYIPVLESELMSGRGCEAYIGTDIFADVSGESYAKQPTSAVNGSGWVRNTHFHAVLDAEYDRGAASNIIYGPVLEMLYMSKSRGANLVSLASRLALSTELEFPSTFMVGVWDDGISTDIEEAIGTARKVLSESRDTKTALENFSEDTLYNHAFKEYGGSVYHGVGSTLLKLGFDAAAGQITTEVRDIEQLNGNVSAIVLPYRGMRGQ